MDKPIVTRVDPSDKKGRSRMFENCGVDHWFYQGEPEKAQVKQKDGKILDVWLFDYARISTAEVKSHMFRARMEIDGLSAYEAMAICVNQPQGFPCSEIKLTLVE